MIRKSKLFLVSSEFKAVELRPLMGEEWHVYSVYTRLVGRRYDLIVMAAEDIRNKLEPEEYLKIMGRIKTSLSYKTGKLIEVY